MFFFHVLFFFINYFYYALNIELHLWPKQKKREMKIGIESFLLFFNSKSLLLNQEQSKFEKEISSMEETHWRVKIAFGSFH